MDFKNKVIWITGASSGLGEAMAHQFNALGAKLILSARKTEELKRVQAAFSAPDTPSVILPLDLRQYKDFPKLAEQARQFFGKIDILVNNGGVSQRSLALDTPFEEDLKILETDLVGTIALTKAALPQIVEQRGQIVVISSVMGKVNTKYRTTYAAAKHGVVGYFESLRLELEDLGVNVCNILPGFIATSITKNAVGATEDVVKNSQNNLGMSAEAFAEKAVKAIFERRGNVYIGGFKEKSAMLLKRLSPSLFDYFIKNQKVT
jgi:dehydrogenase/reductase SDR family member 7B